MATETGFFEFDTNAEAVAQRIGASMAKIQQELNRVTAKTGLQSNFSSAGMMNEIGKINAGLNSLGAGLQRPGARAAQFINQFKAQAVAGLKDVERSLATQVARQPSALLAQTNLGLLGRETFKSYSQGILSQADELVQALPKKFASKAGKNFLGDLGSQLGAASGVASGRLLSTEGLSPMDAAKLKNFYESQVVKAVRAPGSVNLSHIPGLARATAGGDAELAQTALTPSHRPALANLNELTKQRNAAETAAYKQVRAEETAAAKATARQAREDTETARRVRNIETADKAAADAEERDARRDNTRRARNDADTRATANNMNRQYDAQARFALKTETTQKRQYAAAQTAALTENKQRDAATLAGSGTRFGSSAYGKAGGSYYSVDRQGGATRLDPAEPAQRELLAKAMAAEAAQLARLNAQREKELALQRRRTGSLGDNFTSGFLGKGFAGSATGEKPTIAQGIRNEFATLGTVARYSGVYAVLGAVTGSIADTKKEVLDFTDSLTDLKVAMDTSGNAAPSSGLIDQLQQIAVLSGSNTGAALDAAARGIRAFGETAKAGGASANSAGVDIADAATKISLITGKDLRDATGDVVAIASAFGLAASQAGQVVDAVSAAKDFGGDPTNISQGLANFATTAGAAGFTLGEAANALSLVIARTDQSGQAAATRLSRITSILAGTTGRSTIASLNQAGLRDAHNQQIDPTKSVKNQLRQIAEAYQKAAPELKGRIRSALGGTSSMRELLPLLEKGAFDRIISKGADQSGRGDQEVKRRTTDIVGTFKKMQGDLSAIQVNLFRSGAFDGLAIALKGLEPALNVLARLLGLADRLPAPFKYLLGVLIDVKIAMMALKTLGVIQSSSILDVVAPRGPGVVPAAMFGNPTIAAAQANAAVSGAKAGSDAEAAAVQQAHTLAMAEDTVAVKAKTVAELEAAGSTTTSGAADLFEARNSLLAAQADQIEAAKSVQTSLASGLGPRSVGNASTGLLKSSLAIAKVAGVVLTVSELFKAGDKFTAIDSARAKSSQAVIGADLTDPASITEARKSLRANAADLRTSQQNWHSLSSLLVKGSRDAEIATTHAQEAQLAALAKSIRAEDSRNVALKNSSIFGADAASSTAAVAAAFATLTDAGASAYSKLNLLIGAILKIPDPTTGKRPTPTDNAPKFSAGLAGSLLSGITGSAFKTGADGNYLKDKDGNKIPLNLQGGQVGQGRAAGTGATHRLSVTPEHAAEDAAKNLEAIQQAMLKKLTSFNLKKGVAPSKAQLNAIAEAGYKASGLDKLGGDAADLKKNILALLLGKASGDAASAAAAPSTQALNPKTALQQLQGTDKIPGIVKQYTDGIAALPAGDRAGRLKAGADSVKAAQSLLDRAKLPTSPIEPEALAALELGVASFKETVSTAAIADLEELRKAAQARAKGSAAVKAVGKSYFKKLVKTAVEGHNLDGLIAVFNESNQIEIALAIAAQRRVLADKRALVAAIAAARNDPDAKGALAAAQAAVVAAAAALGLLLGGQKYSTAPKTGGDIDGGTDAAVAGLTKQQIEAARRDAQVDPRNGLAQAAADVTTAKANLAAANKTDDPGAFYAAKKALNEAQSKYADLVMSAGQSARSVKVARAGSDLVSAKDAVSTAAEELTKFARGTQEYNDALVKLIGARQAAAETAAKFKFDKRRAGSDLTDTLAQARIDTKEAANKLARDRRTGRGPDVIVADKIDLKNKQNALEQTAFDRRLKDAQNAESLGKISHQAYMKYLQNEHDRLIVIKHKTQQQKDDLTEIDLALKSAVEGLSGQFNLGDIKVPTPYEVRRSATATNAGVNYIGQPVSNQSTVNNSFTINGTDTLVVKRVLTELLGPLATQRNASATRKGK